MPPVRPAARDPDGTPSRIGTFGGAPSTARPSARSTRSTAGRFRIMLHRHRWLRWAAAGGAALAVLAALSDEPSDPPQASVAPAPAGPSSRLPPGARGVPVPVDSAVFAVGDTVDVHAIIDGSPVVLGASVVSATDGEVMLAVPSEQVDTTVDALTTGGVILVLAPSAPSPSS